MHWFLTLFLVFFCAHTIVEIGLDILNLKNIQKHRKSIPPLFSNVLSMNDYEKSIAYTFSKTYFNIVHNLFRFFLSLALIFSGFFNFIDIISYLLIPHSFWSSVSYPFFVMFVLFITELPFTIYYQFVIEERFGFNKMTPKVFIVDTIKSMLLSLLIGVPLIALLFYTVDKTGSYWWLYAFGILMAFQLITAAIFPVLLAPIFYKFSPLADGELKEKISNLAQHLNFKMAGIFTIDGSKRSSHSNAFFAGMGKMRRIVLFDTLIAQQSTNEIVAVVAHEMGHNKKNHIPKGLILSSLTTLFGLYLLSLCIEWPPFFNAFGVIQPSVHAGFVLFALFFSVFFFPISPLFQLISRKNEFEADRFSVETLNNKEHMVSALVKLSKDNLSNLTPHPWYSFYHYSHPTTIERVKAIESI